MQNEILKHDHEECKCHEHHHDHEHEQGHHHEHEHKAVNVYKHDISTVGSVRFQMETAYEKSIDLVEQYMSKTAEEIMERNGIIGHIKAFVTNTGQCCMLSVTDDDNTCRKYTDTNQVSVECVAIVIGIETEQLKEILTQSFPASFEGEIYGI